MVSLPRLASLLTTRLATLKPALKPATHLASLGAQVIAELVPGSNSCRRKKHYPERECALSDTNYAVIYDLHSHTTASDGCLTPEALVHRAVDDKLSNQINSR